MENILRYGNVLGTKSIVNESGIFTTRIVEYECSIYIHEMKNGKVVCIKKLKEVKQ